MAAGTLLGETEIPEAQLLGGGAALWYNEAEATQKIYVDRQFFASFEDQVAALRESRTVYIGNLSFYTTEAQIYELCGRLGPVKRVVMGLNRHSKTPCGFCFVEHFTAEAALENVARITGLVLDDRILRAELDFGFREGRQFGRGQSGGQVRDDRRLVYDKSRSVKQTDANKPIIPAAPESRAASERRKRRFGAADDEPDDDKDDDDDDDEPSSKRVRLVGPQEETNNNNNNTEGEGKDENEKDEDIIMPGTST